MVPADLGLTSSTMLPIAVTAAALAEFFLVRLSVRRFQGRQDRSQKIVLQDCMIPIFWALVSGMFNALWLIEGSDLIEHARSIWAAPVVELGLPLFLSGVFISMGRMTWREYKEIRRVVNYEHKTTMLGEDLDE